jgi:hypothetical protein
MVMLTDNSYKVLNYGSKKIKKTILKFLGKKKKEDKPTPTYVKIGNNSPNYATKSKDPNRGNKVPGIHSTEYLTTTPKPDFDKTKVKKADREKALTDKLQKTVIDRAKKDDSSTLQKLFGPSKEKVEMGKDQMKRARASMGMKHGGVVERTKMGKVRTANPRNIDGIAKRGLTRAKHR